MHLIQLILESNTVNLKLKYFTVFTIHTPSRSEKSQE